MIPTESMQFWLHAALLIVTGYNAYLAIRIKLSISEVKMEFQRDLGALRDEMSHLELRLDRRVTTIETQLRNYERGRSGG